MSTDYNVYIGPYIEVNNPVKQTFEIMGGCPNSITTKETKPLDFF